MNSLLEYEGMGGQVQMIYFDPPYGVKFGSNFQPFVRKHDVKHGSDEDMIREPEMVKAYRDTWELGLHSYLTYLRDRLLMAKELLTESGCIYVQISDQNLHHVRELMDDVFGPDNFLRIIPFVKTTGKGAALLDVTTDFLLWYAKSAEHIKFHQVYMERADTTVKKMFTMLELPDGSIRRMTKSELEEGSAPNGARRFKAQGLYNDSGSENARFRYVFGGRYFVPPSGYYWRTNKVGLDSLASQNRLVAVGNTLSRKQYEEDFGVTAVKALWLDTMPSGFASESSIYVVQTSTKVIQRCVLMSTNPGDLVLDITCGSGTTAYVAEKWGRRWITCDTSRVPLALARQRLLTATFPWYRLKNASQGPAGGFVYERKKNRRGEEVGGLVPRITLKSIANHEEPETVTLVDRPEINIKITRVCGPFTVEATIQVALTLAEEDNKVAEARKGTASPRAYLDRMIEVLRQSKTLRLPSNVSLELETVRPLADREHLHAEATAKNGSDKRIAIVFGPEDGAIGSEYVFNASMEAMQQGFQQLFLFGFAIEANTREMLKKLKIPTTYIAVTPDVVMSDLLKTSKASEIFSITGLPDVTLEPVNKGSNGNQLYQVEVKGPDIFRPDTMETESVDAENLPCWMLDTNYNGMVFCASQVFFPKTGAWDNLQKSLKGEFNESVWEHLAGTVSEPFALGDKRRIAVKVIDDRGNELMVVKGAGPN
jgi:adenine-specific DNA-methyltransferase